MLTITAKSHANDLTIAGPVCPTKVRLDAEELLLTNRSCKLDHVLANITADSAVGWLSILKFGGSWPSSVPIVTARAAPIDSRLPRWTGRPHSARAEPAHEVGHHLADSRASADFIKAEREVQSLLIVEARIFGWPADAEPRGPQALYIRLESVRELKVWIERSLKFISDYLEHKVLDEEGDSVHLALIHDRVGPHADVPID